MDDYTEMTIETYLAERLTKEITSYEKKSHFHRAWFIVFKVIQIIILALVPILASLPIPCFKLLALNCLLSLLRALFWFLKLCLPFQITKINGVFITPHQKNLLQKNSPLKRHLAFIIKKNQPKTASLC